MVKCESLRINMFRITHTGKSVNFPVTISNTDLVAKKLKEDSKISVRFEGNKKQLYFNSNHAEKMKSASNTLSKRKFDLLKKLSGRTGL